MSAEPKVTDRDREVYEEAVREGVSVYRYSGCDGFVSDPTFGHRVIAAYREELEHRMAEEILRPLLIDLGVVRHQGGCGCPGCRAMDLLPKE